MKKSEVKEKLDQVCPDGVCYFYGIPISNFNKHQLQNFIYLLISSMMARDETKIWHDNGFEYSVWKDSK
ncbi:hypothetical protein LCGC14_0448110 [marine sediment metagenome]|uniref:Uncharacterized protein n=1 Tax=marine sediment metagenome TaxID=412755 RepID=A0A0F9V5K1_9ZZZZ